MSNILTDYKRKKNPLPAENRGGRRPVIPSPYSIAEFFDEGKYLDGGYIRNEEIGDVFCCVEEKIDEWLEREKAKENFVEEFPASMIPKSETLKEVREGYGCAGTYHYCTDLAELFSIRESNEKEFEVSLQSKETQHSNSPLLAASFTQRTDHSLSQRIKNYEDSTQNSKNRGVYRNRLMNSTKKLLSAKKKGIPRMYIFFSPRANHDKKTVQKRKKVSRRAEKRSVHIEENGLKSRTVRKAERVYRNRYLGDITTEINELFASQAYQAYKHENPQIYEVFVS